MNFLILFLFLLNKLNYHFNGFLHTCLVFITLFLLFPHISKLLTIGYKQVLDKIIF